MYIIILLYLFYNRMRFLSISSSLGKIRKQCSSKQESNLFLCKTYSKSKIFNLTNREVKFNCSNCLNSILYILTVYI